LSATPRNLRKVELGNHAEHACCNHGTRFAIGDKPIPL